MFFEPGLVVPPPFVCYFADRSLDLSADNYNKQPFCPYIVEVYIDSIDDDRIERLEQLFREHEVSYVRTNTWIEEEQLWQILYTIRFMQPQDINAPVRFDKYVTIRSRLERAHRLEYWIATTSRPGKRVAIVGGLHGDEIAGSAAAKSFVDDFPFDRGTYLILPKASMLAWRLRDRYPGFKRPGSLPESARFTQAQGYYDLNRRFPGSANGNITQRIAHEILRITDSFKPEIFFDLHEGRFPYLYDPVSGEGNRLLDADPSVGDPAVRERQKIVVADTVAALNASGLVSGYDFVPHLSTVAYVPGQETCSRHAAGRYPHAVVMATETTRWETVMSAPLKQSLDTRIKQHRFIVKRVVDKYNEEG